MTTLEGRLRGHRETGRALLVPYITGGVTENWTDYLIAYQDAGADAIEVGLPFSNSMFDGATVQEACDRALAGGTSAARILAELAAVRLDVPLIVMTCANLVVNDGMVRFCVALRTAGVRALIVPDLPLGEVADLEAVAAAEGIELVLLAAPSTDPLRLPEIGARSRGFVYAVSLMGTTGERAELADSASSLAASLKAVTDRPVLLGFGISSPEHARQAGRWADGVVVGSALMRRVLDGAGADEIGAELAAVRGGLDQG